MLSDSVPVLSLHGEALVRRGTVLWMGTSGEQWGKVGKPEAAQRKAASEWAEGRKRRERQTEMAKA